jgi:glutamate--cysteine ligase
MTRLAACERATWVEERVRTQCFGAGIVVANGALTVGAELELLAFDARTHAVAPIACTDGACSSLTFVRDVARRLCWREEISGKGVPRFVSDGGAALTFEPGGQLEYASTVHHSVDALLRELCTVEALLRESAEGCGISLLACGADPFNSADEVPLQLTAERYARMAAYFATIGPAGARMMRQTASLQVNVGGISAIERWPVANAITPWLVALFANSSRYAGSDTGCASYRAETWRFVDEGRTGVFSEGNAVREYSAFALGARAFLADAAAPPFGDLDEELLSEATLSTHLTTLFPEVRPRGYLELRSFDALGVAGRRDAMLFTTGILGDAVAARDALALVGAADETTLRRAGRAGMHDFEIASLAGDLVEIALDGCARIGPSVISSSLLEEAGASLRASVGGRLPLAIATDLG